MGRLKNIWKKKKFVVALIPFRDAHLKSTTLSMTKMAKVGMSVATRITDT